MIPQCLDQAVGVFFGAARARVARRHPQACRAANDTRGDDQPLAVTS
jgi:hypothetical protein